MTAEQREYLAGWAHEARIIFGSKTPQESCARGCIVLSIVVGRASPFTPFGAGQADAALACWGF